MNEMDNLCTYCGTSADLEREHVISAAYLGWRSYDTNLQWIVPACKTCNNLAGSNVFFSIPGKAAYIRKRFKSYFKKVLQAPYWSESEIAEMGYVLRVKIEGMMLAKVMIQRRMQHIEAISSYPTDYLRPKWVERMYLEWLEEKKRASRRRYRKRKQV